MAGACSVSNVEVVSYRGYDNCLRIFNSTAEVVIVPEVGGRVLAYSINDQNIIYRNPQQDGKSFDDFLAERFDPDAGRFDLGYEVITRQLHDTLWMGPYTAEITGRYSVKLTSEVSHTMGVQIEREFILDSHSSHLIVRQTMINRSDDETSWFFWGRTLVPIGGKLVMPLNRNSKYSDGWGYFGGNPWTFQTENPTHPLIETLGDKLVFHAETTGTPYKFATDADQGWMVYKYNDIFFVKRFEVYPEGEYHDYQTSIIYSHGRDFIELEPNSPYAFLKPGESYTFDEHWWLLDDTNLETSKTDIITRVFEALDKAVY